MSNYKPFEKNKMSIEEAIKIINELIDSVEEYGYDYTVEEAVVINKSEYNSIETLLTAYEKEKEKNKDLEKMLNLKSHKRKYNTMNYIKKNKLNKYDTVGICQDMRAFKRTGEIKYRAYITFQNKQYTLGTYTSLDKAKEARKKGEIMVENIKKNFVEKIKGEE